MVLSFRKELKWDQEGKIWWDLTNANGVDLTNYYSDWRKLIKKLETICRKKAKADFKEKFNPLVKEKQTVLGEKIQQLNHSKPDGWEESSENLEKLQSVLTKWNIQLDAIGFISINGGVRNA